MDSEIERRGIKRVEREIKRVEPGEREILKRAGDAGKRARPHSPLSTVHLPQGASAEKTDTSPKNDLKKVICRGQDVGGLVMFSKSASIISCEIAFKSAKSSYLEWP